MIIGQIGAVDTQATTGAQQARGRRPDMSTALAPVAEKLGITVAEVKSALDGGTTLDKLAASKGVSHADLLAAIKEGLGKAQPPAISSSVDATFDIDALAEAIATGSRPTPASSSATGPNRPPHGVNRNDETGLESVSALLDMTTDELVEALMNGTTLTDLATAQGVSATSVLDLLGQGLIVNTTM